MAEPGAAGELEQAAFEPRMLAAGLSALGPAAGGEGAAYLHLELTGTTLDDPAPIGTLRHLQSVCVARNRLTTLAPLSALTALSALDASHNRCNALDFGPAPGSSLRAADLSHNAIDRIGGGLSALTRLASLSLAANRLTSCAGLEGLVGLRELDISGNYVTCLAPLAGARALEVLQAARNHLASCDGVQALTTLRRLDLSGNCLGRLEALAPCSGLALLSELRAKDNPATATQDARRAAVRLLPQLLLLDGAAVSAEERVDAANAGAAGGAAAALAAIRRAHFPAELDGDGGGAVPPKAAGLAPSRAEEEESCPDAAAMLAAVDAWAATVPPAAAALPRGGGAGPARPSADGCWRGGAGAGAAGPAGSRRASGGAAPGAAAPAASASLRSRTSSAGARGATGAAAVASRLAAGCSAAGAPWAELQRARACYSWVCAHAVLPPGCSAESGADEQTWSVGPHLFGEAPEQVALHAALLPGHGGTFAECASALLVALARACGLEAAQLHGWWKAGGAAGVPPGGRLAAHNHAWAAVKVGGRWRLLDPVAGMLGSGQPFFTAPEAFIHSHLPLESCWQLLPSPLSAEAWWQLPEAAPALFAAGGALLDGHLRARTELPPPREGQALPGLMIPLAAPDGEQLFVEARLLDEQRRELARWRRGGGGGGRLVFQQRALAVAAGASPQQQQQQQEEEVVRLEVWVSPPRPGTFYVHLELVRRTPRWLRLAVQGLPTPLDVSRWERQDVVRLCVVVPPVQPREPGAADRDSHVASLPLALPPPALCAAAACGGGSAACQLLRPSPCLLLEADRPERFEVAVSGWAAVAVGCEALGWQPLERGPVAGVFGGAVVLPRAPQCFVAVAQQGGGSWLPLLSLHVTPQEHRLVAVADAHAPPQPDPADPRLARARALLAGLGVGRDGAASRRDMLAAFRRDRQLADHLRMPHRVKAADGTFDAFLAAFAAINTDGLGRVDARQLWAHLVRTGAGPP
ncbi:hypothetical protein HT031_003852 [Scenedesmus sp. PABB004]|nr:hypothetical protein HT031_003852 [Scenedesmus sp. PABB004]